MESKLAKRRASILGALSQQMHGAVTDYVGYSGEKYGINMGVALHTIRSIAQAQQQDKTLSMMLYEDSVRELKLSSLWLVNGDEIAPDELDFWAKGLINTEVCDEAAFVLLRYVEGVEKLLYSDEPLVQYCALVTMSYLEPERIVGHMERIVEVARVDSHHAAYGTVLLLERLAQRGEYRTKVDQIVAALQESPRGDYIREELEWRL